MNNQKTSYYRFLSFTGEGGRFFGIWALNIILTIVTLGLYYPWAKIAVRKYLWNETSMENNRFVFHGTGYEIFKGFVIIYAVFFAFIITLRWFPQAILLMYLVIILITPLAIFGAWRYRVSKTSWRR